MAGSKKGRVYLHWQPGELATLKAHPDWRNSDPRWQKVLPGRTTAMIRCERARKGWHDLVNKPWDSREKKILAMGKRRDLDYADLMLVLPGRSLDAVQYKYRAMGFAPRRTPWTTSETATVAGLLAKGVPPTVIARSGIIRRHSVTAVKERAQELATRPDKRFWSPDEIDVAKHLAPRHPVSDPVWHTFLPNRSPDAIAYKIRQLGLHCYVKAAQ